MGIIVLQVLSVFFFPFLFSLFFTYQSLLTKGHSLAHVRGTLSLLCAHKASQALCSLGLGGLLCALWKGLPCCARTGFFGSHPEPSNCLLFFWRPESTQMHVHSTYMIAHTLSHTHTHIHRALPIATSVRVLLRLQRKRWVQVKPNVCQMLRWSHQEVSLTFKCCCWSGRVESSTSLTRRGGWGVGGGHTSGVSRKSHLWALS